MDSSGASPTLTLEGRLDSETTGDAWRRVHEMIDPAPPARLNVDASRVSYCDGAGLALLVEVRRQVPAAEFQGLSEDLRKQLDFFGAGPAAPPAPAARPGFVEEIGQSTASLAGDLKALVAYIGELTVALVHAMTHPRTVRWKDTLVATERAGVTALPIISLTGVLIGLIMGFQAANALKGLGAELFIADAVGVSLLRELGPLMTAIILAGRSGAAFAAEIGTMRVNEEINALTTMGLSPVRFLVVPRVIASVVVSPLLTVYLNLLGVFGGLLVCLTVGVPPVAYARQLQNAVSSGDLAGGLAKSLIFGLLIAAVGCLRGLQTRTGASAVGQAATRAVVSSLILIIVTDGLLAYVYHVLGI